MSRFCTWEMGHGINVDRRLEGEWVCGRVINLVWGMLGWTCLQDVQMEVCTGGCKFQSGAQETSLPSLRIFMHCFQISGSLTESGLRTKSYMRGILSSMLQELLFVSTPTPGGESREVKRNEYTTETSVAEGASSFRKHIANCHVASPEAPSYHPMIYKWICLSY